VPPRVPFAAFRREHRRRNWHKKLNVLAKPHSCVGTKAASACQKSEYLLYFVVLLKAGPAAATPLKDRSGRSADWLLWQLADSAFPSGGFAHSGGLEAAYQHGQVSNREELGIFLEAAINQVGRSAIPFVSATFDGSRPFAEIDWICDAYTSNHVANRASRAQGQAFAASAEKAFSRPELKQLRMDLFESPGHFAPVFGNVASILELDRDSALRVFLFTQIRGWISSAVRLGIVGPGSGQNLQAGLADRAEATLAACAKLSLDEVSQTAPLLDLFQGCHDRLYSRLFQS
jgi:urease accessory protein